MVSLFVCSFTTVIGAPVGLESFSIILVFFVSNGVVKMFLKNNGREKKEQKKRIALFAKSKLNRM